MPPKRITKSEEEAIHKRLDDQDQTLTELKQMMSEMLLCLKGSRSLQIDGVLDKQNDANEEIKKLNEEIKSLRDDVEREIDLLKRWQDNVQKYLDILNSKTFRKTVVVFIILMIGVVLYIKGGWIAIQKAFKFLFELVR